MKIKPQWVCVYGSLSKGIKAYGPFDDPKIADEFRDQYCCDDVVSEVIEVINPHRKRDWQKILDYVKRNGTQAEQAAEEAAEELKKYG